VIRAGINGSDSRNLLCDLDRPQYRHCWYSSVRPFPFVFLTMIVSLEAIFLTLFVLATQNRMTVDADRRAHLDLQVNLLSEQEMTLQVTP
jgi:uncharacterized membrane protein